MTRRKGWAPASANCAQDGVMEDEVQTPATGRRRRVAVGLMLTGIGSVQLGSALATTLFDELGPGGTVFLRSLFAAIVLLAIWRPARAALDRQSMRDVVLYAIVLGGMNLSFYEALNRLPLGIAVTLEFTGPLAVALLGSPQIASTSSGHSWPALGSCSSRPTSATASMPSERCSRSQQPSSGDVHPYRGAGWAGARRTRRPLPRHGDLRPASVADRVADAGADLFDPRLAVVGLGVAMLSSVIAYTVELKALRILPASTFGVLLSLEPAAAALVGAIALNQALAGREVLAVALVVVASAGALRTGPALEAPDV